MMDSEVAIQRLQKALDEIPGLTQTTNPTPEFNQWYRFTETTIARIFGENSSHVDQFREPLVGFVENQPAHLTESELMSQEFFATNQDKIVGVRTPYTRALESGAAILESFVKEIEISGENAPQHIGTSNAPKGQAMNTDKIFIVHGRDEGAKHQVARLIGELGLEPVILDEQADEGRTIIAKFEQKAMGVGFAVVLLTPDDEGRLKGEDSDPRPRARQNVIFELGYFIGSLGRNRVCALTKGDVDLPSDYDGVVYIPLDDAGGWKLKLVKELQEVGFDVDANRAL